jgi:hypothetical protein
MAYTQKQHARQLVEAATEPKDRLENLLAREDSMMAWKQQKAVCDLDALQECPEKITAETPPCCPKAPLSTAEQAADAEARKQIEAELAAPPEDDKGKGKRKGKNRKGNP